MEEEFSKAPAEPAANVNLRILVQRAQAGDATALPRIREILDSDPAIWRHVGDLSALAERAWIAIFAADDPLAVESMKRTVAEMKADLAGVQPSRLEQMLVDEVVASWIEVKYLEMVSASQGHASLDQVAFKLKRLESAKKRYLTAIKTLTSVRTLMPAGLAPVSPPKLYEEAKQERA